MLAVLVTAVGVGALIDQIVFAPDASRPQQILEALVSGPQRVAPGATAYVSGPNGTWVGAAGIANVRTGAPMKADARLRIQSNSKTWLLAVALQLAGEGKLNLADTVSHWLPGLLPYGNQITLLALMTDTSGLIDDNVRDAFLFFVHPTGWTPAKGGCPGNPIEGIGTGSASRSYVYFATAGNRVAVLLLNGDRAATGADDPRAEAAAASLYCGA